MKNLKTVFAGILICATSILVVNSAINQKPAGKPWPAPASAEKMKNPVKADDSSIKEGKDLYNQHCKSCHGAKGKGDGSKAEKIDISCGDFSSAETKKATDGELYWKTTEGRKPMPSYKEKLSDSERWKVINYIRTF
jgi:mono/diheme cytochrome c family protein